MVKAFVTQVGLNLTLIIYTISFQTRKLSIGSMRKRTKSDAECEEYVCPMDTEVPVPLQKIFSPRVRKNESVQKDIVTSQKTRGNEQQVSETTNNRKSKYKLLQPIVITVKA